MSVVDEGDASECSFGAQTTQETLTSNQQHDITHVRFFACYLLRSRPHPSRSYVGFTVDPARRIRQHNGDVSAGGAHRTTKNRPWDMLALVHGFISSTQAMQFEWAWQNPHKTKALKLHALRPKAIPLRKQTQHSTTTERVAALAALLSVPPWSRCPLTITVPIEMTKWENAVLDTKFPPWTRIDFRPVAAVGDLNNYDFGSVEIVPGRSMTGPCAVCSEDTRIRRGSFCITCGLTFHVHCVASAADHCQFWDTYSSPEARCLIPESITCRRCGRDIAWNEVVRFARVVLQSNFNETYCGVVV